ncbi:MAG: molybdopterin-dependent oxidoreductase, partial [Thermomicrobiales bacterium]
VLAGAAGVALALPSYRLLNTLYDEATFSYDGRPYSGPGVQPITPNDQFYSVTKNVVDPDVTKTFWRLEVDGLVEDAKRYSFDDLAAMEATTQETTLMCISNRIGAGLFSNAVWQGVPMRELLMATGVRDGAKEVRLHAADGFTDTFAIEKALDPTTLVAYRMNDEPLPERHGYPVRVIVPGLYGEKNVKWVTRIEVVDHDAKGFYEQQGWGPDFTVPTRSDIFSPRWVRRRDDRFTEPWPAGRLVTVRGRAFAGNRGIATVEVSIDGEETWQPARIDYPGTELTWTFWSYTWTPRTPGEVAITSRATDRTGEPQLTATVGTIPQGARGYHRVIGTVEV